MFAGCGNKGGSNSSTQGGKAANDGDIKEFTAFFAVPGSEINDDNEVQQIIAEKTGVKVKETWLTGQTAEEAIGTLVAVMNIRISSVVEMVCRSYMMQVHW